MIKKLFRQMLLTQILSSMTVMVCMLIDSIMIGRFLGVESMTAYGLAAPILLVFAAFGNLISAGVQVVCGKFMGIGDRKGTNACFSASVMLALIISGIGVALILISMILNIVIGFREGNIEKAVFSNNGIAGLLFYGSIAGGVAAMMLFDVEIMSAPFVILFIVIPAVCIFCKVPFAAAVKYKEFRLSNEEEDMTVGNFIVENFFEMFEYVLSYVSNTMSFLRVGGFVLSHAGMMLVVSTLMNMVSTGAKPAVVIIGNAFVMVMEGMIVAIQIIRLEFYEIFSRFYSGSGKPFEPVKAEFSTEIE